MASRNPPPVHAPTSFPLFLSAKDQWNILQYHLHILPLSDTYTSNTHWLDTIDHKILALALVKKRADLELLQTEALHTKRDSTCDIHLPNYDVGFAVPGSPTSPTFQTHAPITTGSGTRIGGTAGGWSNFDGLYLNHRDLSVREYTGRSESGEGGTNLRHPSSPVSPSFGPRSTQTFSGTVSRRRSSQISDGLIPSGAASAGFGNGGVMQSATKDIERRVMFEAAWVEIERNLGEYIRKLVGDDHFGFQKEDLWAELVRLGIEGRMLEERIKVARGGVKD